MTFFNYLSQVFSEFTTSLLEIKPSSLAFVLTILAISVAIYVIAIKSNKDKFTPKILVNGSLAVAIAFVLSYLRIFHFAQGGSITLASMLPLMVFAYIYGTKFGVIAGFVYSILQLIQDMFIVHPAQLLLDYPFAFAAIGFAGLCRKSLPLAVLIAGFSRFLFHFMSGAIFFGEYAPAGQSPFLYSLIVNGTIIGLDTLICFVVSLIPPFKGAINKIKINLS
ncbi:MAG: energy-coupled thiamine transporter ThiT [Clostridium sp.]|uniref:energy-coupled thiamine transporter ThiT n=1 Tax=Clostridium sp. TaxID=1506 RepID=UPI002FCA25B0